MLTDRKFICRACGTSYQLRVGEDWPERCGQCQYDVPESSDATDMPIFETPDTTDKHAARKAIPVYTCFVKYFPRAMAAVATVSRVANDQHNPGSEPHWDRSKSADEQDAMMRHIVDVARGDEVDDDGLLHRAKVAWRAMADLEKFLEG